MASKKETLLTQAQLSPNEVKFDGAIYSATKVVLFGSGLFMPFLARTMDYDRWTKPGTPEDILQARASFRQSRIRDLVSRGIGLNIFVPKEILSQSKSGPGLQSEIRQGLLGHLINTSNSGLAEVRIMPAEQAKRSGPGYATQIAYGPKHSETTVLRESPHGTTDIMLPPLGADAARSFDDLVANAYSEPRSIQMLGQAVVGLEAPER